MTSDEIRQKLEELKGQGANPEKLLARAVELLHNSQASFHWTGIYELFPDNVLRLGPFLGASTDHVLISIGQGVCGSAVAEKRNKNIPDVTKEANYLACSSATRSELVVLIRSGATIYGQIDIDSHDYNAFDARIEKKVKEVADWLAGEYAPVSKQFE